MLSDRVYRVLAKRRGAGDPLAKRQLYAAAYGASLRKLRAMAVNERIRGQVLDTTLTLRLWAAVVSG